MPLPLPLQLELWYIGDNVIAVHCFVVVVVVVIIVVVTAVSVLAGEDVEDSLYWIAYATQPSNVSTFTPSHDGADGSATADTERLHSELRKQIGIEAMRVQQRVPNAVKQSFFDDERVDRLAACMRQEMIDYLKRCKAERDSKMFGGAKQRMFHDAAVQIQAVVRGSFARRKAKGKSPFSTLRISIVHAC